jgi:hypothetical protein
MSGRRIAQTVGWGGLVLGLLVVLSGCTELLTSSSDSGLLPAGQAVEPMAKRTVWRVPGDFATIQEAIDSADVAAGDQIRVGAGSHAGAYVTKPVEIRGEGRAVIDSGPLHPAGLDMGFRLMDGSEGTSINHLTFAVDLAIMNGEAVDSVTVSHCTFESPIQAVSNWSGCDWVISHNLVEDLRTRNGGGIGILVADRSGGVVTGNVVAYNTIRGVLAVWANDGGGYNGSGIVLYADFRYGWPGAEEIRGNRVVHNTVSLVSDTPEVVDVAAFELTDTRDDPTANPYPVIFDNAIGFNDFRGTELEIVLTPEELAEENDISRNLGENRGHGAHPSLFGPGGG